MKKIFDKKKITKLIKDSGTKAFNYMKYNRLFLSFVLFCFINCFLLRCFTVGNWYNNKTVFIDLFIGVLLGSFAYFFDVKHQFKYFFTMMILNTLICVINAVYYAFFGTFVSVGLLMSLGQVGEVGDALLEKLSYTHFLYVIPLILFFIINRILLKKDYFNKVKKVENGKKLFLGGLLVSAIFLTFNLATLSKSSYSSLVKQWNRETIVKSFGVVIYQANDCFQTIRSSLSSLFGTEEALRRFEEYFIANPYQESDNKYTGMLEGYNVVTIHMESIMNMLIGLEINGVEVTPNLNKLIKDSMYFDNFYPQVSSGTSSDTEFTLNTSLMPAQIGTAFVSYYDRNYVTLEKLLAEKGYYTFSMHGNKAAMWNRDKMHPSLGYMDFYSQAYYNIDEEIGLGLSDRSFFKQSDEIITDISEMVKNDDKYTNYMGTMITLTNHTPFDDPYFQDPLTNLDTSFHTGLFDEEGVEITTDFLGEEIIGRYLKSAHYADECLGEFLEYVKNNDAYKKTLFVLYGDHAAQLSKKQFNNFVNYDFNTGKLKDEDDPTYVEYGYYEHELLKNTPLILFTTDKKLKGHFSYPMGMIDVLPTIGNMLGIQNKFALGNDIFEVKNDNVVVFPNGNFLTDKLYYSNSKDEYRIFGTDAIIDADYIIVRKKMSEELLQVSNDMIVYDLIEKSQNRIENSVDKIGSVELNVEG